MTLTFEDITWHDAELRGVIVDRSNPGKKDVVEFEIHNEVDGRLKVCFFGVYRMDCVMNFGIIAPETIRSAHSTDMHRQLDEIRKLWGDAQCNLSSLVLFEFETNSTASKILIAALGVEVSAISGKSF